MGNFIQWQQVGSDQGPVQCHQTSCTVREERGPSTHFLLFPALFVTAQSTSHQTMADTDYKDQIRELRCWTEKTWAPKYRINLLPRNQTSHEQYAAVAEDIFSFRLVLLLSKLQQSSS